MIFNQEKDKFYCKQCKEWISIFPCEYLLIGNNIQCFNFHQNGFFWDIFGCEYLYQYHNENYCKCSQEKCNCNNKEEDCDYPLAKQCYETDLREGEQNERYN